MKFIVLATTLVFAGLAHAANYDVSVTRKGSNLYKVDGKDMFIHTRYCYEYVYSEESILKMSGSYGKIIFTDQGSSCDVKAVFGPGQIAAGKYKVSVSQEDDDWYEDFQTGMFIKTSLCLKLALGEEAILKISATGSGTLYFIDDDDTCSVEGVYSKLRL